MTSPTYGIIPWGDIRSALEYILPLWESHWTCIVRSIDSGRSVDDLSRTLSSLHLPYQIVNGNVSVSVDTLDRGLKEGLFNGFDEVLIFSGNLPAFSLEELRYSTGPAEFPLDVPDALQATMEKTKCVLLLGDGCGLNYAAWDDRILEAIKRYESSTSNLNLSSFSFDVNALNLNPGKDFIVKIPPGLKDKASLVNSLSQELRYPGQSSNSWDALGGLLGHFSWIKEHRIVILHRYLPQLDKNDLAYYLDILSTAVQDWKSSKAHELIVAFPPKARDTIAAIAKKQPPN
ncbi:MAG TPA: hypothetical protein VMU16_14900 [Candidatus Binataceae bacterium]|nr:hypothetical protein [Candidatus Binataceae bacterium]